MNRTEVQFFCGNSLTVIKHPSLLMGSKWCSIRFKTRVGTLHKTVKRSRAWQLLIRVFFWSGNLRHIYFALTGCVSTAGVKDSSANVFGAATHCQIPPVHICHEHTFHISHSCYNQLEFQVSRTYPAYM